MLEDVVTVSMNSSAVGDHRSSGTKALRNFFLLSMPTLHGVVTLMWMRASS